MGLTAAAHALIKDDEEHWIPATARIVRDGLAAMDDKRVFRCVGSLLLLFSYMVGPFIPGPGGDIFRESISLYGVWPVIVGLLGLSSGDLIKLVKAP